LQAITIGERFDGLLGGDPTGFQREADAFDVSLPESCSKRGTTKLGEQVIDTGHDVASVVPP